MVTVPAGVLEQFRAVSLFNSPYRAHDDGQAVDLYPTAGAPSPVAGEVVAIEQVRAPPKPYAPEEDYLLAIDTGTVDSGPDYRTPAGEAPIARLLHVDPAVDVGDRVALGDDLGELVRAGFFAPWVDRHLHLGFREPGADFVRASGSLPVELGVDVEPVEWDGRGTIVETGETYVLLDRPEHPAPDEQFAAIAGSTDGGDLLPLDGGLPHYEFGGVFGSRASGGGVSLLGGTVGTLDGQTVRWDEPTITADGEPITGLSLAAARDRVGAKLICPDRSFDVGDSVRVRIE